MKKTLIALAVLAASGAAMAQSTVTLYGVADINIGTALNKVNGVGETQTKIDSGTLNGSRWGVKGAEDLGGGLKAIFQFESGFNLDTGASAQGGLLFGRQAFVGVTGGFGTLTMGRQYTAYDAVRGTIDTNFDSGLSPVGNVFGYGVVADYDGRQNNTVMFQSANYGGISGAVQIGLGENKTATNDASQALSLNVQYEAGPIYVAYAYQEQKAPDSLTTTASTKYNVIGASYNFGMAKLRAAYNTASVGPNKDKEYMLGVDVPVGAAATVTFGYAHTAGEINGNEFSTGKGYAIVASYDMSKRTALYTGLNNTTHTLTANGVDAQETKTFQVGVRHKF